MRKLLVKLSGHVFDQDDLVKRYVRVIRFILDSSPESKIVLVCGGGSIARRYVSIVRDITHNEAKSDMIGIMASRLNALTLALSVDEAYKSVPSSIDEFLKAYSNSRAVFCGGLQPGQSTATVAMILAEVTGTRDVIFASNIDAVYDKDPLKHRDAKKLEKVTLSELEKILSRDTDVRAGTYPLLDIWAINIAKRAQIRIFLYNCREPEKLIDIVLHGTGYGTLIVPD
ncbi:MAG: UMP kinase [Crenarchaeota archaeon]|nr:UMP kinase [Thermoproteota archaeon]